MPTAVAPITAQAGPDTSPRAKLAAAIQRARELEAAANAARAAIKKLNEQTPPPVLLNGHAVELEDQHADVGADEVRFAPPTFDDGQRAEQLTAQLAGSERARFIALAKHCETVEDDLAAAQARVEGLISELFGTTLADRIEEARRAHDLFIAHVICLHETLDPRCVAPQLTRQIIELLVKAEALHAPFDNAVVGQEVRQWERARAALREDAQAPLPEG